MSQILYDPTGETSSGMRTRLQPLKDLVDKTVMLFDIGKVRSDEFLNYFDQVLKEKGIITARAAKPTNTKAAPREIIDYIVKEADVVIQALSD